MKKIINFIFIILTIFIFSIPLKVFAATGMIKGTYVNVRTSADNTSTSLGELHYPSKVPLISVDIFPSTGGSNCTEGWYKINYNSTEAYICSKYVTVLDDNFENQLLSFPESYRDKLRLLHELHSNWTFIPVLTGLNWEEAVAGESRCGTSYISTSNPAYIDTSCTSAYPPTSSWKPASNTAVAHYMDPRNFLEERYIFQFERVSYNINLNTVYPSLIHETLKNASFYTYHTNNGLSFKDTLYSAGGEAGVSPTFLSARLKQELGTGTILYNLYSGTYTFINDSDQAVPVSAGTTGYYNFFNYGVTDSCANQRGTTYCGIKYAKNNGWDSVFNALRGGASNIKSSYIDTGKYTGYFQKFNVVPTNPNHRYIYQYMTNIAAPSSESSILYSSYTSDNLKSINVLSSDFVFYIPVYNNMDNPISNENNGGIDDGTTDPIYMPINTIVTASGYKYSDNYIKGINPNTSINTLKNNISSVGGNVVVKDRTGKVVTEGNIGSGYTVNVSNSEVSKNLTVIVYGDTSGDGVINALDLLQIQKSILGTYTLSQIEKLAADTSKNNKVNAEDLLHVQKHILGTYKISQ